MTLSYKVILVLKNTFHNNNNNNNNNNNWEYYLT